MHAVSTAALLDELIKIAKSKRADYSSMKGLAGKLFTKDVASSVEHGLPGIVKPRFVPKPLIPNRPPPLPSVAERGARAVASDPKKLLGLQSAHQTYSTADSLMRGTGSGLEGGTTMKAPDLLAAVGRGAPVQHLQQNAQNYLGTVNKAVAPVSPVAPKSPFSLRMGTGTGLSRQSM